MNQKSSRNATPVATENEYKDAVAFIRVGKERRIQPRTVGYAKKNAKGDWAIYLQMIPVGDWDGSLLIQDRRERGEDPDDF